MKNTHRNGERDTNDINNIMDVLEVGIIIVDKDFRIALINKTLERFFGLDRDDVIGQDKRQLIKSRLKTIFEDPENFSEKVLATYDDNTNMENFECHVLPQGDRENRWLEHHSQPIRCGIYTGGRVEMYYDITGRKKMESYRILSVEVLAILNESTDFRNSIQRILTAAKQTTGCDAIGMRLQSSEDFPYFLQNGFSEDFLLTENTLIERDPDGGICRNLDGSVSLECTCGLVISGKTDPSIPLFTKGGSAWTNDSFPLLDIPAEDEPRHNPRNQCIHKGYASVALIPIRTKDSIVGLLQINGYRKGLFTLDAIHALEGIASHIGEAIMRNKAENMLQETNARHSAMIENIGDVIAIMGVDGITEYQSPNVERWFGWKPEDLIGTNSWENVHPEDIERIQKEFINLLEKECVSTVEFRFKCKDGNYKWIELTAVNRINEPAINGVLLNYRDISKRRNAEEAIRESELKFRAIYENATDGILLADPETKMFYTGNDTICRMLGYEKEELEKLGLMEIHPKEAIPYVIDQFDKQARGEITLARDIPVIRKDGSIFYVDINSNLITISGLAYVMGIFRDTTDRRKAQEEMEKLASMVRHSSELINLATLDGRMIFLNEAGSRMLGIEPEEFGNRMIMEVIPDNFIGLVERELLPTLLKGETWEGELQYQNVKTGELTDVYATCFTVTDPATQALLYFANVSRDITERKKAEEEKKALESQLRQSQKLESIETLAGGVAHEINNPIQGIIGYADIINDRIGDDKELKRFAQGIKEESQRIASIVKNLLSFARQGKQKFSYIHIKEIVSISINLISAVLKKHQIKVEIKIPEELPKIKCKSQQIEQVIINLLTNARDALNQKYEGWHENKTIMISAVSFVEDGDEYVRTTIEDHGAGIPEEIIERIFDPFFTTKERGKGSYTMAAPQGTGLGLSVSYGIISDHSGRLWVESQEGEYTRFHIDLPVDNRLSLEGTGMENGSYKEKMETV